jgi:hypothetical protein
MAASGHTVQRARLTWLGAALATIAFAVLGALWAGVAFGGWLGTSDSLARRLLPVVIGCATGAIGGWSMLRAPRATIFVLVIGLVTPLFLVLCGGLLAAPLLPARPTPDVAEAVTESGRATEGAPRSTRACPVCGAHRLRAVSAPRVDVQGVQPWLDLYAMGDMDAHVPPEIVCEACDSSWPNVEAFEAAADPG